MSVNKMRAIRKPGLQLKRNTKNVYKAGAKEKKTDLKSRVARAPHKAQRPKAQKYVSFGNLWVILFCSCVGFVVIAGICVGTLWMYRVATTSEYFATKEVQILGNVRMSKEMVKDFAGVSEGDNSLNVSIGNVEQALLKTPWVEGVSVKRVLPNRFIITLDERMPSFWIKQEGVLYYADERGKIIAPVETANFMSLPTLEVESGAEHNMSMLGIYLKDLKSGELPVEYGAISAFKISNDKGIELYLDDRDIRLCLELDSWSNNLKRLSITLGDLARRNELSKVKEIRASDGNVWVITKV